MGFAGETAGGAPARPRVLVVDDNETNRDLLVIRLEKQDYRVETAEHGAIALAMLAASPFDLVLLDVMMPEVNGYEVLERIKANPALSHLPVIMISALSEIDSVVRCIELGAEDYLAKPFNPVLLKARVGACLEKKRLRDVEQAHLHQLDSERRRAEELLRVILPDAIIDELKTTDRVRPRRFDNVAVMFCDIVGFTAWCDAREPDAVLADLQLAMEVFETLADAHELQKIKTIGDSFMAAVGLDQPAVDPVLRTVRCALEMVDAVARLPVGWQVRIGVHVGPVMAGIVGRKRYCYDIWGDTVNTAARVEMHGVPGVNVSAAAWATIAKDCFGHSRGFVTVKGKGELELFFIDGLRASTR